jgi:flagellar FliL protein
MANPPTEATTPQAQKKTRPLILVAAVLILGAGGAVALVGRGGGEHGAEEPEHHGAAASRAGLPGIVALDPFVLNLADPEGERYVRAAVHIALERPEDAERVSADVLKLARVRDRILTSLSSKTADEVTSFDGREELRGELKRAIAPLFGDDKVADVYFTEFLVQ